MTEQSSQKHLGRALDQLRQFRRKQASDRGPGHERSRVRAVVGGLMMIFMAHAYAVWQHDWCYDCYSMLVASLGFWIALTGIFSPISYPVCRSAGLLLQVILHIPHILFFETRMHLLELMLIVALLGNGIGLVIGQTQDSDASTTVVLCVLWSILVLGGVGPVGLHNPPHRERVDPLHTDPVRGHLPNVHPRDRRSADLDV